MAENESLDLWGRHSGRWRQLLRKIENNERPEDIANEVVRCLYQTFKSLVDLLPLPDLIDAAEHDPERVREILRRCRSACDYAELFAQFSAVHSDPVGLITAVTWFTFDRFLDQIGMKVVGARPWPDVARFRLMRHAVRGLIEGEVNRLAQQVAGNPGSKPRMPARSSEQKEQDQRDMLGLSLRTHQSGTHG